MDFDAATLFAVNVAVTFANALLLLWCWLRNREEQSLGWVALGYGLAGVGNVLLAMYASVAPSLAIEIANGTVILGLAMLWIAARVFNQRRASFLVPVAGVAIWLVALRIPAVGESAEWRIVINSAIIAFYCLAAAREFWIRDGLNSRFPLAIVLIFHAAAVLLRIPTALVEGIGATLDFNSPWFAPFALETLVFVQAGAVLLLSLTKERAEARLREMALTDPLTGLANRRAFFEQGARLIAQSKRLAIPTSMVAFDLDRFKQINDTYGHPFGDAVLEAFAIATRSGLRGGDLAGRIGGEEFAAILPGADEAEARIASDRVVTIFADLVGASADHRARFTASAGLAVSPASKESIEALFAAADRALYDAKNLGGDQLRTFAEVLAA